MLVIIVAVVVGTVSFLKWLEGFVDGRIANPAVERPPAQGIAEAQVEGLIQARLNALENGVSEPRVREIVGELVSDLPPFLDAQGAVVAFDRDSGCPSSG